MKLQKNKITTRTAVLASLSVSVLLAGQAYSTIIFSSDFTSAADGPISNSTGWTGQANWLIASGRATSPAGFQRAENFTSFTPQIGETVIITISNLIYDGGADAFAFGFASTPEHTGAQTPQVRAELGFVGGALSVGGAADPGYDLGSDSVNLTLEFTRLAAGDWDLVTSISNITDGSVFTGSAVTPTNLDGQTAASAGLTVSEFLDADPSNTVQASVRGLATGTNTISFDGYQVEVVPEPSSALLVGLGSLLLARRRRSNSQ